MTLGQLRKFAESAGEFELLLQDSDANSYIPDLIHYQYATMLSDARRWQDSHQHFAAAFNSKKAPPALATLAHLNAGKCLDALGKRDQAVLEYQTVLKKKDVFDSHDLAKKYLKKPFVPSPEEFSKTGGLDMNRIVEISREHGIEYIKEVQD